MSDSRLAIGFLVAAVVVLAVAHWRRRRGGAAEGFLIYPYLDLYDGGYRGNPYALSECGCNAPNPPPS